MWVEEILWLSMLVISFRKIIGSMVVQAYCRNYMYFCVPVKYALIIITVLD
jgi:hypothetical protein